VKCEAGRQGSRRPCLEFLILWKVKIETHEFARGLDGTHFFRIYKGALIKSLSELDMKLFTEPLRNFFQKYQRRVIVSAFQPANIALPYPNPFSQLFLCEILLGASIDN
jgi:hypothetical protein